MCEFVQNSLVLAPMNPTNCKTTTSNAKQFEEVFESRFYLFALERQIEQTYSFPID